MNRQVDQALITLLRHCCGVDSEGESSALVLQTELTHDQTAMKTDDPKSTDDGSNPPDHAGGDQG